MLSKSRISKASPNETAKEPNEDVKNNYALFVKRYEDDIRKFGMMRRSEDSQSFLGAKPHLLARFTMSYLNAWCVELVLEGKNELMNPVAYQDLGVTLLGVRNQLKELDKIIPLFT